MIARVQELHKKGTLVPPILLSNLLPISGLMTASALGPATGITLPVRDKFFEVAGYPNRPVSAPAPSYNSGNDTPVSLSGRTTPLNSVGDGSVSSGHVNNQSTNHQPRPQRVHRVSISEDSPFAAHYNLPWTEDEIRRLDELLLIFPEEEVISRRYAKIAEAFGTRSASQISNRINKLNAKKLRHAKRDAEAAKAEETRQQRMAKRIQGTAETLLAEIEEDLEIDEETKATPLYREYLELQEQARNLSIQASEEEEEEEFTCDGCGQTPIIGVRFHCQDCTEVDFCLPCQLKGAHDPSHSLIRIEN